MFDTLSHRPPKRTVVIGGDFNLTNWVTFGTSNPTEPDRFTATGIAGITKELLEIGGTYRVEIEGISSNAGIFVSNSTTQLNSLQSFQAGDFSGIFTFVAMTAHFAIGQLMGIANLIILTKLRIIRLI